MSIKEKDPFLGSRIREYEILEVIGKGGMGAVYRGRHIYLEEERAIKVIQRRLAEDRSFVERFQREARILTKLHHPNLLQLYEFGTLDDDVSFMVMELIRGQSVLDRIRRCRQIAIPDAVRIIRQAALGLHSAHQKGIVHRDIAPDNLMIVADEDGAETVKIIDFGIAKPLFEAQGRTVTNMFVGKTEYCSPEQCGLLEEGEIIDRRSDIYSLGVTFYQMLAGRLPFRASSPQGYLLKHAGEVPAPVSSHFTNGEFPADLERIVLKMMAKKRDDRYSSLEEVIREIDRLDFSGMQVSEIKPGGRPIEAGSSSELEIGNLFARRYLIEKQIGEGGMGTVYRAIDTFLEVPVALKILNSSLGENEGALERFKREVILARKVTHPNACRIFDIGEFSGVHYVSMEFLEGQTLADLLETNNRLTPEIGLPIVAQVLQALKEAHRAGVIHRDLKPENIMVHVDQKATIMDFGISISKHVPRVTQAGITLGSPQYMSPEQIEDREVDARTDIYSMGVILFEVLTGKLPLTPSPTRPSQIIPDLSPALDPAILKALETDPADRYQTASEFLIALDPFLRSTTSSVPIETVSQGRALRRALLAMASLLLFGYFLFQPLQPRKITQMPPPPSPPMITVSINAIPWARVVLRSDSPNVRVPSFSIEDTTTPCTLRVPAGTYRLTLSNDGLTAPLERKVTLSPDQSNTFLFDMPNYDAAAIAAQVQAKP